MNEQAEPELDRCKIEAKTTQEFREAIPEIVNRLVGSCRREDCFDHVGPEPIPSRDEVIDIIHRGFRLLFPGYFIRKRLDQISLGYYFGQEAVAFFEVLSRQIALAIRHECLRHDLPCTRCEERGQEDAIRFMQELPNLRSALAKDVRAAFEGDPAAKSYDEIIFSYPGLFAVTVYRLAHQLMHQYVPLMPRIMTEYAHSQTGIDIHPGAHIGESFFIDHGTGVVIGETCVIGRNVRIYQGVTLGAKSFPLDQDGHPIKGVDRHPIVEDDVIIYSNATILGRITIGRGSSIGGNVWLTHPVPAGSVITQANSGPGKPPPKK
jgi:serine O-acetyltransferase